MRIRPLFNKFFGKRPTKRPIDELREIAAGDQPIFFGPFFTEIGFETLYWIPFLNWFKHEFKIDPERIVAISRGGAHSWYRHITKNYVDIFDHYSLGDFKLKNDLRVATNKKNKLSNPAKHRVVSDMDDEIMELVRKKENISNYTVLHPAHMFKMMKEIRTSPDLGLTKFEFFEKSDAPEISETLPDHYVAVKFWFGGQFKDTEENKTFIKNLIETLARSNNVVLLNTGLDIERHDWFDRWFNELEYKNKNIFSIRQHVRLQNNLHIQTAVISRSKMFIGTYGGFAYVSPFVGVPAMTFFSNEDGYLYAHLDIMRRALRILRLKTDCNIDFIPYDVKLFNYCAENLFGVNLSQAAEVVV